MKINYKIPIAIAIFVTVLSQAPLLRERFGFDTQLMMLPFWVIAFLAVLSNSRTITVAKQKNVLLLFAIILFGTLLLEINPNATYFSSFTISIGIALFLFLIGNQSAEMLFNEKDYRMIVYPYIVASFLLAVDIYIEYLSGYDFNTIRYVFRAKNSAGQILITAAILLMFELKRKKGRILKVAIILFFIIELVLMRSRATVLSIIFVPIVLLGSASIKKRYKIGIITGLLMIVVFFTLNEDAYNVIVNNLLLKSTTSIDWRSANIDYLSSNRLSIIAEAQRNLKGNELLGLGSVFYVDNLFVCALGHYGIIIGIFVCLLAILPAYYALRARKVVPNAENKSELIIILQIISFVYVFNALFEGWAPFGPGGKCFFLWLLLGMILAKTPES